MPNLRLCLLRLEIELADDIEPSLGVLGDDSRKLGGSNVDRIDANAQQWR
jgi:hypothetical protein